MKAAVVSEAGGAFQLRDVDLAEPAGAEVLIEVKASGLCHSDLTARQTGMGMPFPLVLGHEVAGIVTAVGPAVHGFAVGDHVVGTLIAPCGSCANCLAGRSTSCQNPGATYRAAGEAPRLSANGASVFQGFGLGGFAQRALVHQNQLAKIPESVPWAQASLLGCGVLTGAGSVLNGARVETGDTVVIMGAGGVGLNAVSGAVLAGAGKIIVTDIDDGKLERAKAFGATDVVNSKAANPVTAVQELTGGGADHVFDFVGAPAVTAQGYAMLGPRGGLYLIGISPDPAAAIELPLAPTLGLQRKVEGLVMGRSNVKRDIPLYAELYLQGRFNLDDLVTDTIRLDQIDEGYERIRSGATARVVITDFDV